MQLVFFSDIHGNEYAFDSFLEELKSISYDMVIFCGDVFGYYYGQEYILTKMKKLDRLVCILGNHDKYFLDILEDAKNEDELVIRYGHSYRNIRDKISECNVDFVKSFIPYWELIGDDIRIGAFHGSPEDYINARVYPDTDINHVSPYKKYEVVILGHTHHKMVRHVGEAIVINPGSLGQQRDGKGCSYLLLDTKEKSYSFHTIEYNIDALIHEVNINDYGNERLKEVLYRQK